MLVLTVLLLYTTSVFACRDNSSCGPIENHSLSTHNDNEFRQSLLSLQKQLFWGGDNAGKGIEEKLTEHNRVVVANDISTDLSVLANDPEFIQIDSLVDSAPVSSNCNETSGVYGDCNFRSAVAYCVSALTQGASDCVINFPQSGSIINMDPRLGEIIVTDISGSITLYGNNCILQRKEVPLKYSSLLRISTSESTSYPLDWEVHDLTIRGFGSSSIATGGALSFTALMSVILRNITFQENTADRGGSVYLNQCNHVIIEYCLFTLGKANYGGSLYIDTQNNDIVIIDSQFTTNIATSRGGSLYSKERNDNLILSGCTFMSNRVVSTDGGAIAISSDCMNATFLGCLFVGNHAKEG